MCTLFSEKIELIFSKLKYCYIILLFFLLLAFAAKQLLQAYTMHDMEEHFGIFTHNRILKNIPQSYSHETKKKEPTCPVVFGSF